MESSATSCSARVGRMPTMTRRLPTVRARVSALLRSSRSSVSRVASESPPSVRGGTLISRLNCPTSVAQTGLAIASSAAALRIDGIPCSSTRFSSISWPTVEGSSSNRRSRSMRANTSSERLTLSRYRRRSSPLILMAWISRPTSGSAQRGRSAFDVSFVPVSRRVQPRALIADPQVQQSAQVGGELVVLVGRVDRLDRPDQQLVEVGAGHPVQHQLVQAGQRGRAEVLVTVGLEERVGQLAVLAQLVPVRHARFVGHGEVAVGL